MFAYCRNLKEIPILDVSNGTDFNHMFIYCGDGTVDLDLSHWKNHNYADLSYLLQYAKFKTIKLPKDWKVKNLDNAFTNYMGRSLDLSEFDTSEVTSMQYTFYNTDLRSIKLGDMSKVKSLRHTFEFCRKLQALEAIDASSITDTSDCFRYVNALKDFGGCTNISANLEFESCESLSYESMLNILNGLAPVTNSRTLTFDQYNVDILSDDDIAIATSKGWIVRPAKSVTQKVNVTSLSQIPTSQKRLHPRVYDFRYFTGQWGDESSLKTNLPNASYISNAEFNLDSTTDASYMLANSYAYFVTLNNTSNVRSMKGAFYEMPFLETLTITGDVSNLEDVTDLFYDVRTEGTFYYNPQYDYSKIINVLPEKWVAKPIE